MEDPEAKIDVSKIHHTGQVEKKGDDMLGLWSTRYSTAQHSATQYSLAGWLRCVAVDQILCDGRSHDALVQR